MSGWRCASAEARPKVFWIAIVCALTMAGCGLADFDVTQSDTLLIPGTMHAGASTAFGGGFKNLSLSGSKEFANSGTDPSHVGGIFVRTVHVEFTDANPSNLDDVLSSIELFVDAPGQMKTRIAFLTEFPAASSADLMTDSSVNLKPFATASSMTISATVTLKQAPLFDTHLKTTVTLHVNVKLI